MGGRSFPSVYPVPRKGRAAGTAEVPPSKSVAHRALILGALAEGVTEVHPLPEGEDVAATLSCLEVLGAAPETTARGVTVRGLGGVPVSPRQPLDCRSSGTTLRLLMALCGSRKGRSTLDGSAQLRRRSIKALADALVELGARVEYGEREGSPPVMVEGAPWRGGEVAVRVSESSQFLSGLLMAGALAEERVAFRAEGLVSSAYVEMTAALMADFGVRVSRPAPHLWVVEPGRYRAANRVVEPDASGAAFLYAAAAVTGGAVTVRGIRGDMIQGDSVFPSLLKTMGSEVTEEPEGLRVEGRPRTGLSADVRTCPDLVPPLVSVALFAPSPTHLEGVGHLRGKESDRLAVLAEGVRALGGAMEVGPDDLTLHPSGRYRPARLDPLGDHRMAMAFTIMGLGVPGTEVLDPACVVKSFPSFFDELERLLQS